jgi:hypothetical protein
MAKKKVEKKDSDMVRVFSKREGIVICPDGTIIEFEKSLEVSNETWNWIEKTFSNIIIRVD